MEKDRKILEDELSRFKPVLEFQEKYPNTSINILSSPKFHIWLHVDEGTLTEEQMSRIKILRSHAIPSDRKNSVDI
jgi:hypothetical protein